MIIPCGDKYIFIAAGPQQIYQITTLLLLFIAAGAQWLDVNSSSLRKTRTRMKTKTTKTRMMAKTRRTRMKTRTKTRT